jgi:transposase
LDHPVRFIVTQGQASEYDQAASLIAGFKADIVLADPGYDANRLIALIRA